MRKALRIGKIEIDTQKPNDPQWIVATIQTLEISDTGDTLSERMRDGKLFRRVDKVASETVTIIDPVTRQEITLSVAGIATAIKTKMTEWILADNDGQLDLGLGMVIKNDSDS